MNIVINPGSGPVDEATEELACLAMEQLVKDTGSERFERGKRSDDGGGRYAFKIYRRDKSGELFCVEVDMPGVPLGQVRYLGQPQNIWNFPRLYVDGSSWVWCYAVSTIRGHGEE